MAEEKILDWVKDNVGAGSTDAYDNEIKNYINKAILTLAQIGINSDDSIVPKFYVITGEETWEDYLGNNSSIEPIKDYIHLSVRLDFDPPANSFTLQSLKDELSELEWRLNLFYEEDGFTQTSGGGL